MSYWPSASEPLACDWSDVFASSRQKETKAAKAMPIGTKRAPQLRSERLLRVGRPRGPSLDPDTKAGQMRALLLEFGAMTRRELADGVEGCKVPQVAGILFNDIKQGRIRMIKAPGQLMRFELAAT